MTYARKEGNITPSLADDNAEEDENEQVVMRVELAIEIADTAQPTQEEIKEYESFSSKFIICGIIFILMQFDLTLSRFIGHFPKPGTKAEARMIALDDKNLEETDDSEEEEEEKQEAQVDKNGKPFKSKTTRE